MSDSASSQSSHSVDSSLQIQQDLIGNQNQAINQVLGGIVLYVTGGQAIINPVSSDQRQAELQASPTEIGTNPYKGLLAFHAEDHADYFGRAKEIQLLWDTFKVMQQPETAIRLLPIYGPSGSGKSSLARAGLIPELGKNPLPGQDRARVAVLMPGTQPLQSLAAILARIAEGDLTPVKKTREFAEELALSNKEGQYDGLQRIANVLPEIATFPLIVLVDQFEEVYSLCKDVQERDAFIANLLYASSDLSRYVSVILTMRSDFLGETQKHSTLNRLFSTQGFLVPAMDEVSLREAIAKPAELAGYPLDEATISLLIEQTKSRDGALPLLQFTLTRIWAGLQQGKAPSQTLDQIGGVGGALAGEAQHIYDSLPPQEQVIARRVFLGLVQLGEGARDTRRRVAVESLVSYRDEPNQVKRVIERFAKPGARLITCSATDDGGETAEVTHEALFDHWQALIQWLDQSRDDLRFQRRLEDATQYWNQQGRHDGNLWRPPDLDLLTQYRQRSGDHLSPLQLEFFRTSRKSERIRKGLKYLGVSALVGGLLFTTYQLQELQQQRVEQLAKTADALLVSHPVEAQINAMAAITLAQSAFVRFPNNPIPISAQNSLLKTIQVNQEENILRHRATVYSIAFTRDGNTIASSDRDNTIRLWNAHTGSPIKTLLSTQRAATYSVAFSPDGKRLVSGSKDGMMWLWDVQTGKPIQQFSPSQQNGVESAVFSPDGKTIASGGGDGTVRLWNAITGKPIGKPFLGHRAVVYEVAYSPDDKTIASASGDGTVRLWNAITGKPIGKPFLGHEEMVWSVQFSPDGKTVASGSGDGTIRLWDVDTGHLIGKPLRGHETTVYSVVFSPDGKTLISGGGDNTVRLWDVRSGKPIGKPLRGHNDSVYVVAASPDRRIFASGSDDGSIRLWNANPSQQGKPLRGHEDIVYAVALSPDRKTLVSGSRDKSLRLWNTATGKLIGEPLWGHKEPVESVAFSPDGRMIISGSSDKTIRRWDAVTGKPIGQPLMGHDDEVRTVAFSPNSKIIVSGSNDKTIRRWDAVTGKLIGSPITGHQSTVYAVAYSLDGRTIASASKDKTIRLWNAVTGKPIKEPLHGHADSVRSIAFSPDSKTIVSGSSDKTIRLWDVQNGQAIGIPLKAHDDDVWSVAFSPDGKLIASGSGDSTVRLWEASSGTLIGYPLTGHENAVLSVSFSSDSKTIVSGSRDNTIRIWPVSWAISSEDLLQVACDQLQYHSELLNAKTDIANWAIQPCRERFWKH